MSKLGNGIPVWAVPWLLGAAVLILVAWTASDYGLAWDEPQYFHSSDLEMQWFKKLGENLIQGRLGGSLNDKTITEAWYWNPYLVPHPPFSRILSGISKTVFAGLVGNFLAYRLPSVLLFSLLVVVMYMWMGEIFGITTGLLAALLLLLLPNLFAQAHFAMTDMPLTVLWFLAAYCFWRGLESWRWAVALGIVWGLAVATKFPALLIPIPLLLWSHLYHRRSYGNNVFCMVFLSPIVALSIQPYLWHQTAVRFVTFLYASVSRSYRWETNFGIYFLHSIFPSSGLPWYYPFFMIGITIPEPILFLFLIGAPAAAWGWRRREVMALFLVNVLFVPCIGLFPGAVLHDVNRLMLPALPFLAGLAGFGFLVGSEWLIRKAEGLPAIAGIGNLGRTLTAALALLVIAPPAVNTITYHPYELSYYNQLVGGIRGAYGRGLEVTYLMEAFTPKFLNYLNEKLPPDATINASFSNFMFRLYQEKGLLRRDLKITDHHDFDYYILLNRQSAFSDGDRAFLATKPAVDDAWRFYGVPFIYILRPHK